MCALDRSHASGRRSPASARARRGRASHWSRKSAFAAEGPRAALSAPRMSRPHYQSHPPRRASAGASVALALPSHSHPGPRRHRVHPRIHSPTRRVPRAVARSCRRRPTRAAPAISSSVPATPRFEKSTGPACRPAAEHRVTSVAHDRARRDEARCIWRRFAADPHPATRVTTSSRTRPRIVPGRS